MPVIERGAEAALAEVLRAVEAWENDEPLGRDQPDGCDADFLNYIGAVVRRALDAR
jgi:hypothetical protein